MKKLISLILVAVLAFSMLFTLTACGEYASSGTKQNIENTQVATDKLTEGQQTPTDIDYSLERFNLIRRAYWVNGQREKANTLVCAVEKPLGYIVLFTESGSVVGRFVVDGKVSSLNSYLSPNYTESYYSNGGVINTELADVDGSYGENDNGIFFFTPDGKYVEWTGTYLYSDIQRHNAKNNHSFQSCFNVTSTSNRICPADTVAILYGQSIQPLVW